MSLLPAKRIKKAKPLHSYFVNYTIPEEKKTQTMPLEADNINMALIEFDRRWSKGMTEVVSIIKFR